MKGCTRRFVALSLSLGAGLALSFFSFCSALPFTSDDRTQMIEYVTRARDANRKCFDQFTEHTLGPFCYDNKLRRAYLDGKGRASPVQEKGRPLRYECQDAIDPLMKEVRQHIYEWRNAGLEGFRKVARLLKNYYDCGDDVKEHLDKLCDDIQAVSDAYMKYEERFKKIKDFGRSILFKNAVPSKIDESDPIERLIKAKTEEEKEKFSGVLLEDSSDCFRRTDKIGSSLIRIINSIHIDDSIDSDDDDNE
jgi:hypothetical protein